MSKETHYLLVGFPALPESMEAASYHLFELGALGCEEKEGLLIGYFADQDLTLLQKNLETKAATIRASGLALSGESIKAERLPVENWHVGWHRYFRPIFIGERLVIRPPWEPVPLQGDMQEIILEPKQAFGTGNHATTKLMLEAIVSREQHLPDRALDIGTGSGILSMAHTLLNRRARLIACDIDPLAIENSQENTTLHSLENRNHFFVGPVEALNLERATFPLIYANLQRFIILPILGSMCSLLSVDGELLISGILHTEKDEMVRAISKHGLVVTNITQDQEWIRIDARKNKHFESKHSPDGQKR